MPVAGADPFQEAEARQEDAAAALKREFARLRSLVTEPDEVFLVTVDGRRWLTDRCILIDITGSPATEDVIDGEYRLQAGKGFVYRDRHVEPDVEGFLHRIAEEQVWLPVRATTVSLRQEEHDLLIYAQAPNGTRTPCAIDAELWNAWHAAYDNNKKEDRRAVFQKCGARFRILLWGEDGQELAAYVQPIRIPDGTEDEPDLRMLAQLVVDHWKEKSELHEEASELSAPAAE